MGRVSRFLLKFERPPGEFAEPSDLECVAPSFFLENAFVHRVPESKKFKFLFEN